MLRRYSRSLFNFGSSVPWKLSHRMGFVKNFPENIEFVIENADWAIRRVGENLEREINLIEPGALRLTTKPNRVNGRVLHFGSQYMWLTWARVVSKNNSVVSSFFHGKPEDGESVARHIDEFLCSVDKLSRVVTGATIVEQRLLDWGVPREKLVKIPIGVDTNLFRPASSDEQKTARVSLNIPDHVFLIGSFQKDGEGWGEGLKPKLIKGPDLLAGALSFLKESGVPIFLLLTGPARGFVKNVCDALGVPFLHRRVKSHAELVEFYHALDCYIVSSREEGGPMGLTEAMSSGVPVVSTRVGMAPDVISNNRNGFLIDDFDGEVIGKGLLKVANMVNKDVQKMRLHARQDILPFDWSHVARQHWSKVYQPLINHDFIKR